MCMVGGENGFKDRYSRIYYKSQTHAKMKMVSLICPMEVNEYTHDLGLRDTTVEWNYLKINPMSSSAV